MSGIEDLTLALQRAYPGITLERVPGANAGAEETGIWAVRHPAALVEVMVESANGEAPFSVESELAPPTVANTVAMAVRLVIDRLGLRSTTS